MLPGWGARFLSRLDLTESAWRQRAVRRVKNWPGLRQWKSQKLLLVLQDIAEIQSSIPVALHVVGGFAYDGLRGRITAQHGDLDLAVPAEDASVVVEALRVRGFLVSVKSAHAFGAWRAGQHVDLFCWKDAGHGQVEHVSADTVVRMPREFLLAGQPAELQGIQFRVASSAFLTATLPFIRIAAHQEFVRSLAANLTCDSRREVVEIRIEATVHEFSTPNRESGS